MVSPLTATSPLSAFTLKAPDAECKEQTGVAIISVSMAKKRGKKAGYRFQKSVWRCHSQTWPICDDQGWYDSFFGA